jgi:hypothetical protein
MGSSAVLAVEAVGLLLFFLGAMGRQRKAVRLLWRCEDSPGLPRAWGLTPDHSS